MKHSRKIDLSRPLLKITAFLLVYLSFYFIVFSFFKEPSENDYAYSNNNENLFGLKLPSNLTFCGEKIPTNNYEIRKNLEKEFFDHTYWKANSEILFGKAARWFPYIEEILKEEKVPDDFKYIAVIESHLANVYSSAGAAGFWQLVPASAQEYGLVIDDEVDERLDVEKSTRAACKHFKEAYEKFGNWTLSAAAYNLGIGGIENALERQKTDNYYDLLLNKETGSFIYRILAYKTLLSSPQHFGLKKKKLKKTSKIPVKTVIVDSSLNDISNLAKYYKCSKATFRLFNPWLKTDRYTNNEKKPVKFKIPKDVNRDYAAYYMDITGKDGFKEEGSERKLPENNDTLSVISSGNIKYHLIRINETIKDIAELYKVSEQNILKWNHLKSSNELKPEMNIIIYSEAKRDEERKSIKVE